MYGINERWGNLKERDQLEDIGVDGGIILDIPSKVGRGGMDCIYLARTGTGGGHLWIQ